MADRCESCGGRLDRPGLFDCESGHPAPTPAQRIVWEVECNLNSRRGIDWSSLDDEVADELRDTLTGVVDGILSESRP